MGTGFEARQGRLTELLGSGSPLDLRTGTLVVIPSITFPESELRKIVGIQYYEERLMFLLLLLENPELRIVYPTSLRIEEPIVDYYLRFVSDEHKPGDRLYLLALWDQQPRSLTEKLLDSPEALDRMKTLAGDDSVMVSFNVTSYERALAEKLEVPLYGCPHELIPWGFKTGSRQIALEAGVPVLDGAEDLHSIEEVETALFALRERQPDAVAAVLKLNEGFSGQGNAIIGLKTLRSPLSRTGTVFCASEETWSSFGPKIAEQGAIVELLLRVPGATSPSVQVRIAPDGSYEILSTHDQILGGPDNQVYLGCRFPANERYRVKIQRAGLAIAEVLASKGVMGAFGIDFVVMPGEDPDLFLSEINMRLGGTTHPYLMTKAVTGGTYDMDAGHLIVDGAPRYYVATDNMKSSGSVGLLPEQLISAVDEEGLGFDPVTKTGTTLHLLGALERFGKFGMTCVAASMPEADDLFERVSDLVKTLRPRTDAEDAVET